MRKPNCLNLERKTIEYDDLGRRTAVTDAVDTAVASTTKTEYDLSRQTQVIDAKDAPGITITKYDDVGNVVAVTDPVNNTTTFGYDARNRLISETNQLDATRSFEYDGVGNQIAAVDRNNRRREFVIDGLNRQTEENWLDSDGSKVRTITYTFDAAGQLTEVSDPDSTYSYTYDPLGRRTSVDNVGTPGVPKVVLNYSYDSEGKLLSVSDTIEDVEGGTISYSYDERDRVTGITNSGNDLAEKRVDFNYNNIGQLESINRYSDLEGSQLVQSSTYSYDLKNRLESLNHGSSAFYEFEYDGGDRITQIVDVDGTVDYSYDKTNQLTGANRSDVNNPDESYSYDANGNRVTSHLHDNDYATGSNNRLESDGTYSYEYDGEGNLIRRTEVASGKVTEYSWDYRNRLVAVTELDEGGNVMKEVEFTYGATGDRLSKTVDDTPDDGVEGVATYFVSDRDDVLLEFVDADGPGDASEPVLVHRYLHGPQVDQILAREDGDGETVWHLTDHLGTVRDLVDNDGEVLNHLVYDSFGRVVSMTDETVGGRYRFTGREFDEETGLYYYRARYYDGDVGRFISSDPIGFESGDVNLYRYVGNGPVDRVDPLGLFGFVLHQERRIEYEDNGRKFTDNIRVVEEALDRNSNVSITSDETVAWITFLPVNTGREAYGRPPSMRGGLIADHRGHIVGRQLGGDGHTNNLFAQNPQINGGIWRVYETEVRNYLDNANIDPDCLPTLLRYSVNLSYIFRDPSLPLRPNLVVGLALFTDGHIMPMPVPNP